MSKDWRAYALHIVDTADRIEQIRERGDLTQDGVLYAATLRHLQTLSEATQRLPEGLKDGYPNLPWQQISDFRNILVHNYLGNIDPHTVLGVVEHDLAPLVVAVREMLAHDSGDGH